MEGFIFELLLAVISDCLLLSEVGFVPNDITMLMSQEDDPKIFGVNPRKSHP